MCIELESCLQRLQLFRLGLDSVPGLTLCRKHWTGTIQFKPKTQFLFQKFTVLGDTLLLWSQSRMKKHCNGMEKSYPCSTFEEKWARLALHSVGTIQIEPIVLYQSTNACFEQARRAQFVNLSYSNSKVPHEYSGKSGILMSHVFMCPSRNGAEFVSDMEQKWDHASLTSTNDSYYIQSFALDGSWCTTYKIGKHC